MAASVEEYQQALLQSCVNGDAASVETYVQQFQQYGVDMNFTTESGRNLVSETVIFAGIGHINVIVLRTIMWLIDTCSIKCSRKVFRCPPNSPSSGCHIT